MIYCCVCKWYLENTCVWFLWLLNDMAECSKVAGVSNSQYIYNTDTLSLEKIKLKRQQQETHTQNKRLEHAVSYTGRINSNYKPAKPINVQCLFCKQTIAFCLVCIVSSMCCSIAISLLYFLVIYIVFAISFISLELAGVPHSSCSSRSILGLVFSSLRYNKFVFHCICLKLFLHERD